MISVIKDVCVKHIIATTEFGIRPIIFIRPNFLTPPFYYLFAVNKYPDVLTHLFRSCGTCPVRFVLVAFSLHLPGNTETYMIPFILPVSNVLPSLDFIYSMSVMEFKEIYDAGITQKMHGKCKPERCKSHNIFYAVRRITYVLTQFCFQCITLVHKRPKYVFISQTVLSITLIHVTKQIQGC